MEFQTPTVFRTSGRPSILPTPSVVITATRHPMPYVDAPASMSVVTREQIEQRGADNVLQALLGESGVTLQGRTIKVGAGPTCAQHRFDNPAALLDWLHTLLQQH